MLLHFNLQCRSQWPRGLRRRSTAARLLRLWVRIPPGSWMSVCCEYFVLSRRGLCDALITHPEESYRLWCVVVCDLETSRMRRPWPLAPQKTKFKLQWKQFCDKFVRVTKEWRGWRKGVEIWRVIADKGWSCSFGDGWHDEMLTTPHRRNSECYGTSHKASG